MVWVPHTYTSEESQVSPSYLVLGASDSFRTASHSPATSKTKAPSMVPAAAFTPLELTCTFALPGSSLRPRGVTLIQALRS